MTNALAGLALSGPAGFGVFFISEELPLGSDLLHETAMEGDVASERTVASQELNRLLDEVRGGDSGALSALYERTSAKLYGICVRLLGRGSEADDVLQEVYVTVWQKAGRFDAGKASAITWLSVIARNKAIDRLRRRRLPTATLDVGMQVADDSPDALEVIESKQQSARLAHCLDELETRQSKMIRAAFLDGATYPQLAEQQSVPLGTMKGWIRRGLLRLRECLER